MDERFGGESPEEAESFVDPTKINSDAEIEQPTASNEKTQEESEGNRQATDLLRMMGREPTTRAESIEMATNKLEGLQNFEFTDNPVSDIERFLKQIDREHYLEDVSDLPNTIKTVRLTTLLQELNGFYRMDFPINTNLEKGQDLERAAATDGDVRLTDGEELPYSLWYLRNVEHTLQRQEKARISEELIVRLMNKESEISSQSDEKSNGLLETKQNFASEYVDWLDQRVESHRQELIQLRSKIDLIISSINARKARGAEQVVDKALELKETIALFNFDADQLSDSLPEVIGGWDLNRLSLKDLSYTQERTSTNLGKMTSSAEQMKKELEQLQERIDSELQ